MTTSPDSTTPPAPRAPTPPSVLNLDLSRIRHDLRTPINHILGYCEMLQEEATVRRTSSPT